MFRPITIAILTGGKDLVQLSEIIATRLLVTEKEMLRDYSAWQKKIIK
jgi:hypothetical protein